MQHLDEERDLDRVSSLEVVLQIGFVGSLCFIPTHAGYLRLAASLIRLAPSVRCFLRLAASINQLELWTSNTRATVRQHSIPPETDYHDVGQPHGKGWLR